MGTVLMSIFTVLLEVILFNVCPSFSVVPPIVEIQDGKVAGTVIHSWHGRPFYAFYGIPYAAPPVAKFRFKEPQPVEPWTDTRNNSIDHPCYHYSISAHTGFGDEDCLYLDVFTSKLPSSGQSLKSDVMVYIPGGGFMYGFPLSFNGPDYIFDSDAADDIVFVHIKYRVGPLGFLSTGDDTVPGNNGLKDQVAALEWVQRNIAAFGGNAKSVTLYGLSAGGASVQYHFLSPMSDGLFHRGYSMSGTPLNPWAFSEKNVEKTRGLAASLGCPTNTSMELVTCLQDKPAESIVLYSAQLQVWRDNPFSPWGPSVEVNASKPFLDEDPYRLLERGKVKDLPWVTSYTTDEGLFPTAVYAENEGNALSELDEKWNDIAPHLLDFGNTMPLAHHSTISSEVRKFYFGNQSISMDTFKTLTQAVGDRLFSVGIQQSARLQAAANTAPVYLLRFAAPSRKSATTFFSKSTKNYGVSHADDIPYVLHTKVFGEVYGSEEDWALSRLLVNAWLSFAKTGVPTVGNTTWFPVSKDIKRVGDLDFLKIRGYNDVKALKKPSLNNYEFWTSLGYHPY